MGPVREVNGVQVDAVVGPVLGTETPRVPGRTRISRKGPALAGGGLGGPDLKGVGLEEECPVPCPGSGYKSPHVCPLEEKGRRVGGLSERLVDPKEGYRYRVGRGRRSHVWEVRELRRSYLEEGGGVVAFIHRGESPIVGERDQ